MTPAGGSSARRKTRAKIQAEGMGGALATLPGVHVGSQEGFLEEEGICQQGLEETTKAPKWQREEKNSRLSDGWGGSEREGKA